MAHLGQMVGDNKILKVSGFIEERRRRRRLMTTFGDFFEVIFSRGRFFCVVNSDLRMVFILQPVNARTVATVLLHSLFLRDFLRFKID